MKTTILAVSIALASSSAYADLSNYQKSKLPPINTIEKTEPSLSDVDTSKEVAPVAVETKKDEHEIYLTVSNIEIEDSVEYLTFGVGGQSVEKNALYTQIGGQFSTLSNAPDNISEKIINLETKIGYSFDGEHVAFIPYVGASVGILMYDYEYNYGYGSTEISDTEFLTRLFVGAELRVAQTVGVYFNTGVVTVFDTNLDFSEIGVKVSF